MAPRSFPAELALLVVLLLCACGSDTRPPPTQGDKSDVVTDGIDDGVDTGIGDTGGATTIGTDGAVGTDGTDQGGTGTDDGGSGWEPIDAEPGKLGWPCASENDCDSDWCINSKDGKVCTEFCGECPQGWSCVEVPGTDLTFVCAPNDTHLCSPCTTNEECVEYIDQAGNSCINYGEAGSFCGIKCETDENCPKGYSCQELPTTEIPQCIPVDGNGAPAECQCYKLATLLGKSTTCFRANEFGQCYGFRECAPSGLTECSADAPQVEICNAQDDNCDNAIDNITVPEQCFVSNEFGTCAGILTCIAGLGTGKCDAATPEAELCDGIDQNCDGIKDDGFEDTDGDLQANCVDEDDDNDGIVDEQDNCPFDANPNQEDNEGDLIGDVCDPDDDNDLHPDVNDCEPKNPAIFPSGSEICDGEDNDCDNLVDEDLCDDGNPCTDDKCNTDGSCTNTPNNKVCDDGTVCTQVDVCQGGTCKGNNPMNCDDGNPCTDDPCDPTVGCLHNNNNAPCDDGNKCTESDSCANGSCQPGNQVSCDDGNPCTQSPGCSPLTGCAASQPITGPACTNSGGHPDCQGGFCQAGVCVAQNGIFCKVTNDPACGNGSCSNGSCIAMGGGVCSDDDACTLNDFCAGGSCQGGQEYDCKQVCQAMGAFCVAIGGCVEIFGSPSCTGACFCP